jgi:hypothetical protein
LDEIVLLLNCLVGSAKTRRIPIHATSLRKFRNFDESRIRDMLRIRLKKIVGLAWLGDLRWALRRAGVPEACCCSA